MHLNPKPVASVTQLCLRLMPYAARRWGGLLAVLATLFAKTGLDLLAPWPMKLIVDHVLDQKPMPTPLAQVVELLPGTATREGILAWAIGGTIALFALGWALGV